MITKEQVLDALKEVIDPELQINIVDLGLVYDVKITPAKASAHKQNSKQELLSQEMFNVEIQMTLTSPGCPLSMVFEELVPDAVKKVDGVKTVKIDLVWEPPWDPEKISDDAKEELGIIR